MSLPGNKARLLAITRDLSVQWDQTKQTWRDAKCQKFEKEFLTELFVRVDDAARVLDDLEKAVAQLKRDCE